MNTILYLFSTTSGVKTIDIIVWGIYIGVMIAIVLSVITRINLNKMISRIIRSKADEMPAAKTLSELKLENNIILKGMLKPTSPLMKYLKLSNREEAVTNSASGFKSFWYKKILGNDLPEKIDLSKAKFYLPEDKRIAAEFRFSKEKLPVLTVVLSALILFAVACFALKLVPQYITSLENIY